MSEKWEKLKAGVKISDKYQIIRKQQPGGGGPTFLGIMIESKRPVHIRFYSPDHIPDIKSFNERLKRAKKAHGQAPDFVTLPSDYSFHEDLPYVIHGISNIKTLEAFLESGATVSGSDVKAAVDTILKALEKIHGDGIVHLGLSPLSLHQKEGSFGSMKLGLLDFGLTPDRGHDYFTFPSMDEKLVSIAAYAAPEQASLSAGIDHRADLYSIGATAYRLVMGRPPFHAGSPREIVEKIISEQPPGLDGSDPELAAPLKHFLERAMKKDPKDRFQNAAEMLESFTKAAEGDEGEKALEPRSPEPFKVTESSKVPKHTPIVIIKVSESESVKIEESSADEITAEIISRADIVTQPRDPSRSPQAARKIRKPKNKTDLFIKVPDAIKAAAAKGAAGTPPAEPKEAKERTDLFIKVPEAIAEHGDGKKEAPAPLAAEDEARPGEKPAGEVPHVRARPPKPQVTFKKAKDKTELLIKTSVEPPEPAKEEKEAPAGAPKKKALGVLGKLKDLEHRPAPASAKAQAQADEYVDFAAEEKAPRKKPPPPPPKAPKAAKETAKAARPEVPEKKKAEKEALEKKPLKKSLLGKIALGKKAVIKDKIQEARNKGEEKAAAKEEKEKPVKPEKPARPGAPKVPVFGISDELVDELPIDVETGQKPEEPEAPAKPEKAVAPEKIKAPAVTEKFEEEKPPALIPSIVAAGRDSLVKLKEKLPRKKLVLWTGIGAVPAIILGIILIVIAASGEKTDTEEAEQVSTEPRTEAPSETKQETAPEQPSQAQPEKKAQAAAEKPEAAAEKPEAAAEKPEAAAEKPEAAAEKPEAAKQPETEKAGKKAKPKKAAVKTTKKKAQKTKPPKKKVEKKKPETAKKKKKKKGSSKLEFVD